MAHDAQSHSFSGRTFRAPDLALIREIVASCSGLSRAELAHTVCELLDWRRPSGALKALECRQFLEQLADGGELSLPAKRKGRPVGSRTRIPVTERGGRGAVLEGTVREVAPVMLEAVSTPSDQALFRELVGRYHYLGYRLPYGAQVRYLISVSQPRRQVVGCVQFSSPAWRMAARDEWIGWDDSTRLRNLQRIVNNSRFLILPWVQVKNLASRVLSQAVRRLAIDWPQRYGAEPLLVETLVDARRFRATCYRAANWHVLGETTGRGRMDRQHQRHGVAPKTVLVYPLRADAARRLRES